jgi:hypothetical protein
MLEAAKEFAQRSKIAQHAYARFMVYWSDLSASRGNHLKWAEDLLRGMRIVGLPRLGVAGERRMRRLIKDCCSSNEHPAPSSRNKLLIDFQQTREARTTRDEFSKYSVYDRVRMRFPREVNDPDRQGDLILLKRYNPDSGEKGVILLSYTEGVRRFAALFDVSAMAQQYSIVLEPSWWGYEDPTFFFFLGHDLDVVVQSSWRRDFDFVRSLNSNLIPIGLGAGLWMNPAIFQPGTGERRYDLAMISSWNPFKRHQDLFSMLARIKARHRRSLRVILIGYPNVWSMEDVQKLARDHRVEDCCTFVENIPQVEVARLLAHSAAYILLSRNEGSNRALYEALLCDTPAIVYRDHRGVNTEHVNTATGVLFDEGGLDAAVLGVIDGRKAFSPRQWALDNVGYENASRQLNATLRRVAEARGLPWSADIVPKVNAPNPRYVSSKSREYFDEEYARLTQFLLPGGDE